MRRQHRVPPTPRVSPISPPGDWGATQAEHRTRCRARGVGGPACAGRTSRAVWMSLDGGRRGKRSAEYNTMPGESSRLQTDQYLSLDIKLIVSLSVTTNSDHPGGLCGAPEVRTPRASKRVGSNRLSRRHVEGTSSRRDSTHVWVLSVRVNTFGMLAFEAPFERFRVTTNTLATRPACHRQARMRVCHTEHCTTLFSSPSDHQHSRNSSRMPFGKLGCEFATHSTGQRSPLRVTVNTPTTRPACPRQGLLRLRVSTCYTKTISSGARRYDKHSALSVYMRALTPRHPATDLR